MALRRLLVTLIVLSTVAFAIGALLERSNRGPAAEGTVTETTAHEEGGQAVEGSGETRQGEETLFGIGPESPALIVFAIVVSLLLAGGCWLRPDWRWLLVVTAFAMAVFAVVDLREVIHQLDESNTGLAIMAGAVAILHAASAVTAVLLRRRSGGPEAFAAA
jgi:hypothetical protein